MTHPTSKRSHRQALRIVGFVFVVCGLFAFAVLLNPTARAALVTLSTEPLQSWAWLGLPSDQNTPTGQAPGSATDSSIGFVHLNCASNGTCNPLVGSYPNVQVDVDTGAVNGWAWLGSAASDTGGAYALGWIDFDPAPLPDASVYADARCPAGSRYPALDVTLFPDPVCVDARIDVVNQQEVYGWARISTLGAYGDSVLGSTAQDNDWGWVLLRGVNSADGAEFGLLYQEGVLNGWAYSGGGTVPSVGVDPSTGLGWLSFSTAGDGSTSGPVTAYVSTEQGDVYVGGGIENPAGTLSPSQYNATYLILSSNNETVVNFNSELLGEGNFTQTDYEALELPQEANNYTTSLGSLKIDALTTPVDGTRNTYGDEVVALASLSSLSGNVFLDGAVYVIDNGAAGHQSYTLSDAVTFMNGTSALPSGDFDGSGVIVVNGDLVIDAQSFYSATQLFDITNLASVAWIVRGDVIVSPQVANIVGAFIVVGDEVVDGANDGAFITQPSSESSLLLSGLVMARSFQLQRTYQGVPNVDQPAELLYYDGRTVLNPPPGLRDFTSTLPRLGSE